MRTEKGECVLCGRECQVYRELDTHINHYACDSCGEFARTPEAQMYHLNNLSGLDKQRIAACTRERNIRGLPPLLLSAHETAQDPSAQTFPVTYVLNNIFPTRIQDRFDRVLASLCKMTRCPGEAVRLTPIDILPVTFSETLAVTTFLLDELVDRGLIKVPPRGKGMTGPMRYVTVTGAGIERIQQLEGSEGRESSSRAFVAMYFHKSLDALFEEGIEPGVRDCGFTALRIDAKETNQKVCDEIIAEIRQSKFVVADFTENRGGVYFEAGFAMGLGIPVIWTCQNEEKHIKALHFDTRQYSHILWDSPEDMRKKLADRIAATIPGAQLSR